MPLAHVKPLFAPPPVYKKFNNIGSKKGFTKSSILCEKFLDGLNILLPLHSLCKRHVCVKREN